MVTDSSIQGNDIFVADILKSAFDDGTLEEDEIVPQGFVKVKDFRNPYVHKSTVVFSIYNNRERVSADRLRRFITSKKKAIVLSDHIICGGFVRMMIEMAPEICQVVGFRKMDPKKARIQSREWPLRNENGELNKDIGAYLQLFKEDSLGSGLKFVRSLPLPISLDNFICHLSYEELIKLFQGSLIDAEI